MESAGCCRACEQEFYEPRREEWNLGWRPLQKDIDAALKKRIFVAR
jgi:hypothetical protein